MVTWVLSGVIVGKSFYSLLLFSSRGALYPSLFCLIFMSTDFAWAAAPLTLVPVCLRKSPSPGLLVIKHSGQEERMPRWQNTAIASGAVVIIIIVAIIFRQALPIQLQNTSASPCQGRAGLAFEKLLCPSAGTDEQNKIETEQKTSTDKQMKRLNVGSLRGMAWGQDVSAI